MIWLKVNVGSSHNFGEVLIPQQIQAYKSQLLCELSDDEGEVKLCQMVDDLNFGHFYDEYA